MAIQFVTRQIKDSAITNAKLANASVTIAGQSVALGASLAAATLAGQLPIDDLAAPDAAVSFNSQKITNLATPVADSDAANKSYVDTVAQGLDLKESVKVATTGDITLSGTQTIDGIAVAADERVLVKDQSTGTENGIYLCKAGSWTRATDFAAGDDEAGAFCFVEQGTVNGDAGFVCTNDAGSAVVGTDALSFTQFSGAGQVIAGDGLAKTGNTLSVNVDDSSIEIDSDSLRVKALGITNAMLAGSIDNAKLSNSTISGVALGASLGNLSLSSELAFNTGSAYNGASARTVSIAALGVTNAMLAGSIADSKLSTIASANKVSGSAVQLTANKGLEDATGLGIKLDGTTLALGSAGIKVNLITNAQIDGSAAISLTKLAAVNSAQIIVGNASNQAAAVNMSGDVAIANNGATTIQTDAVSLNEISARPQTDTFTGNGSLTSFNLNERIATAAWRPGVKVFINGQRIKPVASSPADDSEYTVADNGSVTSITLGAAPLAGDLIQLDYLF